MQLSETLRRPGPTAPEVVVLVDEWNRIVGTMPKVDVHHRDTPLHRGFSIFLFDESGRVLMQQRAEEKPTWPNFWSNSCCGHEQPDEPVTIAAIRRARYELGVTVTDVDVILPDYRYKAEYGGVVENEYCPVMVGRVVETEAAPLRSEVRDVAWVRWEELVARARSGESTLSPWCIEEVLLLDASPLFHQFLKSLGGATEEKTARGRS